MGLVFNGTKVSVKPSELPDGYVAPVVATFKDHKYMEIVKIIVPKAAVQNSDKLVTMANILANATVGISKQVVDSVTADYNIASLTVTAFAVLESFDSNMNNEAGGVFYTDGADNYVCSVKIFIKTA